MSSYRVTSVFVASCDPQRLLAFQAQVKPTHWIVPYSDNRWHTLAQLGWVPAQPPEAWQTLEGIYPLETPVGEVLWVQYPQERIGALLAYKVDWMVADSLAQLKPWRSLANAHTRVFGWSQEPMPPFLSEIEECSGWRCGQFKGRETEREAQSAKRVAIVGGGIAGAFCAYALSLRGIPTLLVDRGVTLASEASALFAGLIHPHWQQADSPLFKLTRAGYLHMLRLLAREPFRSRWGATEELLASDDAMHPTEEALFEPIGVFDMASDDEEWKRWSQAYANGKPFRMPEQFAQLFTKEEAQAQTGLPVARGGWWFPRAGLLYAGRLARALVKASGASVLTNTEVRLAREGKRWALYQVAGEKLAEVSDVIVAGARDSRSILGLSLSELPLMGLKGRISFLEDVPLPEKRLAVTGTGYLMKIPGVLSAMGATYEPLDKTPWSAREAHEHNIGLFESLLPTYPTPPGVWGGFYEGVRAVTTDRLPVVGRAFMEETLKGVSFKGVPELEALPHEKGLWLMTGLGSRGLTWGALCAETCVRELLGEPPLLEAPLRRALHPHRFVQAQWTGKPLAK